jgi:hypothetical protein
MLALNDEKVETRAVVQAALVNPKLYQCLNVFLSN